MRTYFSKQMKRLLSLMLTLAICMTCMPLSAFADAAAARSAPIQSAPFEQPQPADYEAELRPVESAAQDGSVLPDGNGESTSPVSDSEPGSNSQPQGGAVSESRPSESDAPAGAAGSSEPGASSSSLPVSESASESTLEPSPDGSSSADSSSAQEETEGAPEAPSESQGTEDAAELRRPILRGGYDPYEAQYGAPVAMTRSARVFAVGRDAAGTEFKAVITATPNTYTNDAGEEATIDNTLVAAADGTYENAANDMKIDIPADPASTGVSVTANGYTVSLAPLEGDFSRPVVEENAIRFNDVLDGIDIQYTAKEMVLKEDIILLRPVERSAFRYRLDAPGLEARMKDGVLALYKPGTDEAVFTILAPVMTDAAGAASHELSVSLAEENGVQIVTVTADAAWLADPERAYPVLIDPSVQNTYKANASMLTVGNSHYEHGGGYAVAGYAPKSMCGYPNEIDWSINRTLLYFKDVTSVLPENGEIDKAELVLHEYQSLSGGSTGFLVGQLDSRLEYSDVNSHPNYSNHWDFVQAAAQHTVGSFRSQAGATHKIDITETVNNWQKGIDPNYGLMLWTDGESTGTLGSRFYPGQGTEADIPPCIEVTWHEVGDVSSSYPLDDTTILLRPISASDRSGKLEFYGVLWDGVATPKSTLTYRLNVEEKNYTGSMTPGFDYLYPSTEAFEAAFPAGSNKYRRRLSNWQTPLPFMDFDYDTVYFLTAQASKDGTAGAEKTSDTFLVYQVKQFDTISKIASHYGVDYNTLLVDNRTVDGLLVENNTLFIRNPKVTEPYNPAPLTDEDKTKIDTYLVGRGLHCEFGFEPINLNTGNFYLSSEDAVIKDAGGAFVLERSYNSKTASYNSIFGRGWAFTYDESLGKTADGAMAYRRGDGSTAYFEPDGSGGYISPAGEHLQLTALPTETKEINFGTDEDPDIQTFQLYEYEIKKQDGTVHRFNSQGLLVSVTDPQGRVTQLAYDSAFALSSITLPGGQALSIVTDSQNRITEIGLPSGAALKYAYDDAGNLISYTNGSGEATTYSYDGSHQMISWFDANGTAMVTNTYDGEGRVVRQLDGEGHAAELRYEDGKTTATDENGNVTVYHYDGQYRTTRIDYPDGTSESFEYDAGNHRSAFVDRLGNRTAYEYDAAGNLVKQTRFDGASQSYTWNTQNKPTSFIDYDGMATLYKYSDAGDLVKTTYADGTATEIEYNEAHNPVKITDALGSSTQLEYAGGQLVKVIDPAGGVYSFSYDAMGNLTGVTDPEGGVSRTEYDGAGRVTAEQDASGGWTRYELDAGGRLLAQTDAGGNRVSFTYDKADNILTITDGNGNVYLRTYDAAGNRLTETDPLGNTLTMEYDAMNRLISCTDPEGGKTSYSYDALGNRISMTAPDGGVLKYVYDYRTGQVSSVTDALGNVQATEYDSVGRPVKQIYPDGSSVSLEYDEMGRLVRFTDQLGLVTEYAYDAAGREIGQSDSAGRETAYILNENGQKTEVTQPGGGVSQYSYDALGRVTQITDALAHVSGIQYNALGLPVSVTNANGDSIALAYDALGNLTQQTDALGNAAQYRYDALGNVVLAKDALDGQTKYVYDTAGRLTEIHDALGGVTAYELDGRGLPVKITDAAGGEYLLVYDAAGRLVKETAPGGAVTTYEYDLNGNLVRSKNADGLISSWEYDGMGRVVRESDNAGSSASYEYDAAGNVTAVTDALGQTTRYAYDVTGNLVSVTEPGGAETRYAYDLDGNIVSITDAAGKTSHYTYDALGNLIGERDSALREWAYTYDAVGRLAEVADPMGGVTKYGYDANGSLIRQVDAAGGETAFRYDALGRAVSYTDENGNESLAEYDALGNVVRQVMADGGEYQYLYDALGRMTKQRDPMGYVTEYAYDAAGNLASAVLPNGGIYRYEYSAAGALIAETDPMENETVYTNDLLGRVTRKTLPDGAQYTYSYDVLGRVSGLTGPEGRSLSYEYDKRGDLVREIDALGRVTGYSYDVLHQLVEVTDAKLGKTGVAYDDAGNITEVVSPMGLVQQYGYDALDRLTRAADPAGAVTEYLYDAVGSLTQIVEPGGRTTALSYDAAGNLTGVTDPLGRQYAYSYDGMNRLVQYTDAAGNNTAYEYDLNGRLASMQDASGALVRYAYDAMSNVTSMTDGAGRQTRYTYDLLDRLTGVLDGTDVLTSYGYDSVGNLISRTDGSGKTTTYSYDLAGQLTSTTNPAGETAVNEYDAQGNLVKTVQPGGQAVLYDYDALDSLIGKSYAGAEAGVEYSYDADGRLVTMKDASGESSYTYDAAGRLVRAVNSTGAAVEYEYNENGERTAIVYPDGKSVRYEYDAAGRLVTVTGRDGGKTVYEYDEQDNAVKVTRADGSVTAAEYDALGRVVRLENRGKGGAVLSSYAYTYDGGGFITAETAVVDGGTVKRTYAYNGRGELVSSTVNGAETTYAYDGAGNRIRMEGPEGLTLYVYDGAGRMVEEQGPAGVTAYRWDKNGNLIEKTAGGKSTAYEYTAENRLKAVQEGGTLLLELLYDGLGDRAFALRYTQQPATGTAIIRKPGHWAAVKAKGSAEDGQDEAPESASQPSGNNTDKTGPEPETPAQAGAAAGENLFWYGFGQGTLRLSAGYNQALGTELSVWFHEWWNSLFAEAEGEELPVNGEPDYVPEEYSGETKELLEEQGYTEKDVELLEAAGLTEAQVRRVWVKGKETQVPYDYSVVAYDAVYYVNDILAENTQVLTVSSQYYGDESYTYGNERLYAENTKSGQSTYLYDGRGSVVQVLEKLAVVNSMGYTDYGTPTVEKPSAYTSWFGYNGEEHDPLTGLQYLRARYYAPQTGSFTTADSFPGVLNNVLSQNGYTYAGNNPVNFIDPSGHAFALMTDGGGSKGGRPLAPGLLGNTTKLVKDGVPLIKGSAKKNAAASAIRAGVANKAASAPAYQNPFGYIELGGRPVWGPVGLRDLDTMAQQYLQMRGCDASLQRVNTTKDEGTDSSLSKVIVQYFLKPFTNTIQDILSNFNATYTQGISVTGTPGFWDFNAQLGISVDTSGNIALQGSLLVGPTGGSPGASITLYNMLTNAPNVSSLEGLGYQIGGSIGVPVGGVPVAGGGEINIIPKPDENKDGQSNDGAYWGLTISGGLGTPGGEAHAEWGETTTIIQTNVFDVLNDWYDSILAS